MATSKAPRDRKALKVLGEKEEVIRIMIQDFHVVFFFVIVCGFTILSPSEQISVDCFYVHTILAAHATELTYVQESSSASYLATYLPPALMRRFRFSQEAIQPSVDEMQVGVCESANITQLRNNKNKKEHCQ
jgi:hypothetical protein